MKHNKTIVYSSKTYPMTDADLICAELSKLIRDNSAITNEKLNELIRLGVNISMTCSELLD